MTLSPRQARTRIAWDLVFVALLLHGAIGSVSSATAAPRTPSGRSGRALPAAKTDPRELEAREAFAAGDHRKALELFAKLYAETLHPNYLRNIGRCYQYLNDPEKSINSFRDYLRKAKDLKVDDRTEVDGYITEMEALALKRERAVARPTVKDPGPAAAPPNTAHAPPPAPILMQTPVAAAPPPLRTTANWVWIGLGVVVAGTAATVLGLTVFSKSKETSCSPDRICP